MRNRRSITSFKEAFARRRCLVPAAAKDERRRDPSGKTPFAIARRDGKPVALGGMWEEWHSPEGETLRTFATLTTDANPQLSLIQERMPVIIDRDGWKVWLGEEEGDLAALLQPLPADRLRIWPVDRKVNKVSNDGPECGAAQQHASRGNCPAVKRRPERNRKRLPTLLRPAEKRRRPGGCEARRWRMVSSSAARTIVANLPRSLPARFRLSSTTHGP